MPSGVGARVRAVRAVTATAVVAACLAILAAPAHAQAAPSLTIQKVAIGGSTTATFEVVGPGIDGTATLTADAIEGGQPAEAGPPLSGLEIGGNYLITEVEPQEGISAFELTSIECSDGTEVTGGARSVLVQITDENPNITCTFTNEVTRSAILAIKNVVGNTSSWTRPAQFHITCPEFGLDIDIEPPVGPGGPGTYTIGQGSIPPGTCTISETDTGSDAPVIVSMFVTDHGTLVAAGGSSVTFTSVAGGDLVLTVTNQFPPIGQGEPTQPRERPEQGGGTQATTTTTVAGSTTTTTTIATTTTATTTTTVPGGATTTSSGGGQAPTSAPATGPSELPTTGDASGALVVAALVAMLGGLTLVARTRRLVDD